jgi:hypothetical protein
MKETFNQDKREKTKLMTRDNSRRSVRVGEKPLRGIKAEGEYQYVSEDKKIMLNTDAANFDFWLDAFMVSSNVRMAFGKLIKVK